MKVNHSALSVIFFMVLSAISVSPSFAKSAKGISDPKSLLSADLVNQIVDLVDADSERLVDIYKDFHQHPELGFMVHRTAAIVAKELKGLGYQVKTGIGTTGVVAVLENGVGPTVLFRADMDANAVKEATGLPWASTQKVKLPNGGEAPVAHMCGHDAHTTWLLSLAKTMMAIKEQWQGTLVLVAQPAEELIAGASAMVNDGLFTTHQVPKPDYLLALHSVGLPLGVVGGIGGLLMAGTEQLDVTFHGQGGHGARPHDAKDPILMGAQAMTQYQSVISRMLDPRDMGVITVGAFNAGVENNTIPESATLKVNFRFFKDKVHKVLFENVETISNNVARTYGMSEDKLPTIERKGFSAPLVNDTQLVGQLNAALLNSNLVTQKKLISKLRPFTGSEDAHMLVHGLDDVKIGYYGVGTTDPKLYAAALKDKKLAPVLSQHSPQYTVDLAGIPYGAKIAAILTMELLHTEH